MTESAQPNTVDAESAVRLETVSVVVPTYRERENVVQLVEAVERVRETRLPNLDLWIMDDKSNDGSAEAVAAMGRGWVHFIEREGTRGLSAAVLDGLNASAGDLCVVMDADLSHDPGYIPAMLDALDAGADFVVASRYVRGGSTDAGWGVFRWLNSRVATLLSRPLASLRDPMSGFFALRRSTLERGAEFNPIGYKIGLELIVKTGSRVVAEIPIHFADRTRGTSKLSLREQLRFIEHLRRLYIFRFLSRAPRPDR
ncbi:MAG: polyprenol monophosphomannose synthase [Phycisphaeraceae bacterium]|nr:MAG: polyprenol monophosphomannose synthase [Phycisphaeraceae bacterium]